jgi:hypothetical protein
MCIQGAMRLQMVYLASMCLTPPLGWSLTYSINSKDSLRAYEVLGIILGIKATAMMHSVCSR